MTLVSLGYQTDLVLLGFGGSDIEDRGDYLVIRSPRNPTYWWGNFFLLRQVPIPAESQEWVNRFTAEFPAAKHMAFGFDDSKGLVDDLRWFAGNGFTVEAQTVMTTEAIREPHRRNPNAICRAFRSDNDWAQSVELDVICNSDFYGHADYRVYAKEKACTNRRIVEDNHGKWFGAFLGDRLISQMGLFTVGAGLARFQDVETHPSYRRTGFAGTLLHYVGQYGFDMLAARQLVMVADPNYFAINLYRAVGFVPAQTQLRAERAG